MTEGPILVTGAGGFVCSEIALALVRAGRKVTATDMAFDAPTRERLNGIELIEAPLAEATREIGPLRAVIHGAALTADPAALRISAAEHLALNTGLLTTALTAARGAGAGRFLFLSSMGVFRPDDGPRRDNRFTEATVPTGTIPYAAAKRAGEIVTAAAADERMQTLSLRLGNIAGPHEAIRDSRQHLCLIGRMLAEARAASRITVATPDSAREWAWLPDLAGGIAAMMTADWRGVDVMHAGTPPVITDRAIAQAIAARMPGATLQIARGGTRSLRPPMGSDRGSPLRTIDWTPPHAIIERLFGAGVPA